MALRTASAVWEGDLKGGKGSMKLGSGAYEGAYSFASRFENGTGTNPEELIGAAHAGCYSMALSHLLASKGFTPKRVATTAEVKLEKVGDGFKITNINLKMEADVPKIDEKTFMETAEAAKKGCPVSQALASTDITLQAKLLSAAR
ncbi:MAG: peroxiredoxin [Elusimicrobia bacterium RIFCSPLOWO2_01_FULL_60_11]|nr:MAG: peroxiredoxin [Elusimicrobia bacterium RIFCSPLOWO2_01_FULL_60_11]